MVLFAAGIASFIGILSFLHIANNRMKEQVALKEERQRGALVLLGLTLLCAMVVIMSVFCEERLWLYLVFLSPVAQQPSEVPHPYQPRIISVIWTILVGDALVKFATLSLKSFLAAFLCASHRRLRRLYRLCEMSSTLYRAMLPMPLWYAWLLGDGMAKFSSSLVTGLYLTFKLAAVIDQMRGVAAACNAILLQQTVRVSSRARAVCSTVGSARHRPPHLARSCMGGTQPRRR